LWGQRARDPSSAGEGVLVSPPGTLPYPTSVGGTVPVCEEAGLGPFSVLPQD
jgi:hypothetical protein